MNTKRYAIASLATFIVIFVFEWVFHEWVLGAMYRETAELWRPRAEMEGNFLWMFTGQFLFAVVFTYLFTRNYENKGVAEGVRFGYLIALLFTPVLFVKYAVAPYPAYLILGWAVGYFLEFTLAGATAAVFYKAKK